MLVRRSVVKWSVEQMASLPALQGVEVGSGFPGDRGVRAEMVWGSEVTGELGIPVMTGSAPHDYDDVFSVPWQFTVRGAGDLVATEDRVAELMHAVLVWLAEVRTPAHIPELASVVATNARSSCGVTPEGAVGFGELTVEYTTRLAPPGA